MNQPCESGGVLLPNSAVPVLPYTYPRSASAVAVPDRTNSRIIGRSASSTGWPGPGGAAPAGSAPITSTGAAGLPLAMPAATSAICAGLISTSPWPMASAALVVPVLSTGTFPLKMPTGSLQSEPTPYDAAAFDSASAGRSRACWMNVVLQDCAKASVSGTVPRSNLSSFSNSRPSTTVVPGQATGVSGVTAPADSSAVAVIVFMLDPGGNRPESAWPGSAASFDDTARISPVPGRTTTRCVGSG